MSITLRGTKFHYRFMMAGKDYSGPCPGCEVPAGANAKTVEALRQKALKVEAEIRTKVAQEIADREKTEAEIRRNKSVRALVENYRFELTGGKPILIADAYPLAAAKPSKRESHSGYAEARQSYWADFAAFMAGVFPEITDLASVRRTHCEAYVKYLSEHGRYVKEVSYQLSGKRNRTKTVSYVRNYGLSPKTIKEIAGACKSVFARLDEDAGLVRNPWDNVVLPKKDPIDREIFSPAELCRIWEGMQSDPFCYPLFLVAANSGMTEGDICTLKWSEVDWTTGYIRRDRRKTGAKITLPLLPQLADYLRSLPHTGEYIFPQHAELYLHQPSCVSSRVMDFLHGLGIVTTVEIPGRRAVSVKDLHSMRHVFGYRAKRAGIPESVIQKLLGHKLLAMTQHYADHDSDDDLRREIQKFPALFVGGSGAEEPGEITSRQQLASLAYSLPFPEVERLLRLASEPASRCLPALPPAL